MNVLGIELTDKQVESLIEECAGHIRQEMGDGPHSFDLVVDKARIWSERWVRLALPRVAHQDERGRWWVNDIRG